ncbi:hypothetical protein COJ46_22100 [Bacillus sp. AFS077874]|uniref:hypothetical protein n=1 Tax=Bacillus sp. AFS077874 TaxID=2033513 RepID=UPI000BF997B7|nr:hypothetical protein [Bacillus sp. AFS077874]PFM75248.1 hypothetical protein COJ46_22100 [Bacillus sp. AFS077874]
MLTHTVYNVHTKKDLKKILKQNKKHNTIVCFRNNEFAMRTIMERIFIGTPIYNEDAAIRVMAIIDEGSNLIKGYKIEELPTIILFKNKKEVIRIGKELKVPEIVKMLN